MNKYLKEPVNYENKRKHKDKRKSLFETDHDTLTLNRPVFMFSFIS